MERGLRGGFLSQTQRRLSDTIEPHSKTHPPAPRPHRGTGDRRRRGGKRRGATHRRSRRRSVEALQRSQRAAAAERSLDPDRSSSARPPASSAPQAAQPLSDVSRRQPASDDPRTAAHPAADSEFPLRPGPPPTRPLPERRGGHCQQRPFKFAQTKGGGRPPSIRRSSRVLSEQVCDTVAGRAAGLCGQPRAADPSAANEQAKKCRSKQGVLHVRSG